jgi:large subunit ribosomal protein L24
MEYTKTKLKIRKGDIVKIIAGESKGKQGKVLTVFTEKNRALVEGANQVSKHTKPSAKNTQGGIVKQEASVHISNLMLVDPKSGKPSRVGRRVEDGKIVRYAKKSGETVKDNK